MSEIISLLKDYSPAVAILLAAAGGLLYVLKLIVERAVASSFDARAKMLELSLQRRSAFEEKVLTDRFALVTDLSARLQRLTTDYNRTRLGQPAPEGFYKGNEIVPLTRLFDDLEIHRLVLTEEFYELFVREAQLTLRWVNAHEPLESKTVEEQLLRTKADIRVHAETVFGMSQIDSPVAESEAVRPCALPFSGVGRSDGQAFRKVYDRPSPTASRSSP